MTITKVLSRARDIDAVQWNATPDCVRALQALLFPLSPYCTVNVAGEDKPVACGVPCKGAKVYQIADLTFIDVGSWVTKDDQGVITAWTNEQFQATFCAPELIAREPLPLDAPALQFEPRYLDVPLRVTQAEAAMLAKADAPRDVMSQPLISIVDPIIDARD